MLALVTGATGCVGANVVEALIGRGYYVRALRRPTSRLDALAGLAPALASGDVLDPASLQAAMEGCDLVFHAAAVSQYWRQSSRLLYTVNILGTRNVLRAAKDCGVARVVLTSSVAALGVPTHGQPERNESAVFNWLPSRFHYGHSKLLAEAEARRATDAGLDVVIVNPSSVIGRRDVNFVGGEILRAVRRGWFVVAPSGGMGVIAAEAVGLGHVLAAEKGQTGERYVLNGENIAHRDLLVVVAEEIGGRRPLVRAPQWATRVLTVVCRAWVEALGRSCPTALSQLDLSARAMYFDGRRAEHELGLPRIGVRDAVQDAWRWYRQQGLL
jgi:dihydroflavonol-4-reductase